MATSRNQLLSRLACYFATASCLMAGPAMAAKDIPGNSSTAAVLSLSPNDTACEVNGLHDSDWYRVTLVKDQFYAVRLFLGDGDAYRLNVRDKTGKPLVGHDGDNEAATGVEFRAAYAGTYFIELKVTGDDTHTDYCGIAIAKDCANDLATQCKLQPGVAAKGTQFSERDDDYWKFPVVGGKQYRATITQKDPNDLGEDQQVAILNNHGGILSSCITAQIGAVDTCTTPPIKALGTGFYFVKVLENYSTAPGSYTITVKQL